MDCKLLLLLCFATNVGIGVVYRTHTHTHIPLLYYIDNLIGAFISSAGMVRNYMHLHQPFISLKNLWLSTRRKFHGASSVGEMAFCAPRHAVLPSERDGLR